MKESLLGLTTMTILFGLVWLSQGEIYTSKSNLTEHLIQENNEISSINMKEDDSFEDGSTLDDIYTAQDPLDTCEICKNINEVNPNMKYDDQYSNMYNNFTFSEAFKLCRQCQGNDGIFYWKDNLYLTEIKQAEIDVVEKELAASENPPKITHESESSK